MDYGFGIMVREVLNGNRNGETASSAFIANMPHLV